MSEVSAEPESEPAAAATTSADSQDGPESTPPAQAPDEDRRGGEKSLRADLVKERRQRQALEKRLQEIQDRDLTELEKAQKSVTEATARAEAAETAAMRQRAALAAGIPAEHVHRLQGSTEEELAADAKDLAKLLKPAGPRSDPSQGSRADRPRGTDMNDLIRGALRR